MKTNAYESNARLAATTLRDVLSEDTFTTLADLLDAFKTKAARLHLRFDNDDINEALRLVGSNTPLTKEPPQRPVEPPEEVRPLSSEESKEFWGRLKVALARHHVTGVREIPVMTRLRPLSDEEQRQRVVRDDRLKAYRIVQQEILTAALRAAELERVIETGRGDHESER